MPKITPPDGFKTKSQRDDLAKELCMEIWAARQALGDLPLRWKKNEAIDKCNPRAVETDVLEGSETFPMPLWSQRADRIAGSVYEGVTGLEPWIQCISDDPNTSEIADKVEHDLQLLAVKSGLGARLYRALRLATNTNLGIIRVRALPEKGLFEFYELHPQDCVFYPNEICELQELKTIGHRVEKMGSTIKQQIKNGEYFDANLTPGDADVDDMGWERAGRDDVFDRTERTSEPDPNDQRCILYDVVSRRIVNGEVRMLRALVSYSSKEILDLQDYPHSLYNFVDVRYDPEYGRFLPAGSPAQRIQGVQMAYTDNINIILQGSKMSCMPPMYTTGGTLLDTKYRKYNYGEIIELPAGVTIGQLPISFRGEYMVQLLPLLESIADGATRISQVGTGQEYGSADKTAAEIGAVVEGQKQGETQYLAVVADSIEGILYPLLFEMYQAYFDQFKKRWGNALEIQSVDEIAELELRFEVTGRSGPNNPATIVQKLMMLMQLAMQPGTKLDKGAVEMAVVNSLQIPGSSKLLLPETPQMALMDGVMNALKLGMPPQQILQTVQQALMQLVQEMMNAQSGPQQGNGVSSPVPQEAQGSPSGPPLQVQQGYGGG